MKLQSKIFQTERNQISMNNEVNFSQQKISLPFNQLVDIYAFGTNKVFCRNESIKGLTNS